MPNIEFSEKELEDYLCSDNNLKKHLGLKFLKRQYRTPVGVIDIVAYNVKTKRLVIIELKKDYLDHNAYFQLLKYKDFIERVKYERIQYLAVNDARYRMNQPRSIKSYQVDYLLIGKQLSENLIPAVEFWDNDTDANSDFKLFYTLFQFNFERGVQFSYRLVKEQEYEDSLCNSLEGYYCG